MIAHIAIAQAAPSGWETWTANTALIFIAVSFVGASIAMIWFLTKRNQEMLTQMERVIDKISLDGRRYRSVIRTTLTEVKAQGSRIEDLLHALAKAITGRGTGDDGTGTSTRGSA